MVGVRQTSALICTASCGVALVLALSGCWEQPPPPPPPLPFSDDFSDDWDRKSELNPGWILIEPNPASSHRLTRDGFLLVGSGQNGGSNLWPSTNLRETRYNASLLLQPLAPAFNWVAETEIDFDASHHFSGAGFVLTKQTAGFTGASAFHRFEYGKNNFTGMPRTGVEDFLNGFISARFIKYTYGRIYLRLQKTGWSYTLSVSADGETWPAAFTVFDPQPYTYIGLISGRGLSDGQAEVDATPVFKYFKIDVTNRIEVATAGK